MLKVSDYLLEGEENALTARELCRLLNLDPRQVSQAIEAERREGLPICANSGRNPGYYLAANKSEMAAYCRALNHRRNEIGATLLACRKTIHTLPTE